MNHNEVKEYRAELKERVEKHLETLNSRTNKLEDWRNWMLGGMACIGFALTLMGVL